MKSLVLISENTLSYSHNEYSCLKLISFKEDCKIITQIDLFVRNSLYPNRSELLRLIIRDYLKEVGIWNNPSLSKIDPFPLIPNNKSPFILREQQMMIVNFKCTIYITSYKGHINTLIYIIINSC